MNYIDCIGLTQSVDGEQYAKALNLDGVYIRTEGERLDLLRKLREGAGVAVLSGPLGASYWSLASLIVKVKVVPDGTEYDHRTTDIKEWSLYAAGCTKAEVNELIGRNTAPTQKHRLYDKWVKARGLAVDMSSSAKAQPIVVEQFPVEIIRNPAEQLRFLDSLDEYVAFDWEWDIGTEEPVGLAVSSETRNWYLPVRSKEYASSHGQRLRESFSQSVARLACVFHNAKADVGTQYVGEPLRLSGKPIDDTIVEAYLCGDSELGLKALTRKYLGRDPVEYPGDIADLPVELAARYAAAGDTRNTYDLHVKLQAKLRETNQLGIYEQIERPLWPVITSMERTGSVVDLDEVERLITEIEFTQEAMRSRMWTQYRKDISDDKQTKELITQLLGYDVGTLDKRVLSKIPYDWMDVILGYRNLRTLSRNFLGKILGNRQSRIFASFNQAGSSDSSSGKSFRNAPRTGRLSSSNPNLTNQPTEIRSIYTAPEGHLLFKLDFSQLEIRLAAGISNDAVMLDALSNGDIHTMMQQRIYEHTGRLLDRKVAKTGNFNLRYGGSADVLVTILAKERVFLDPQIAKAIVDLDKQTFTGYWQWYDQRVALARQLGYSESIRGRRRYNPDLYSPVPSVRLHAERAAANHEVQGSAADVVKEAMVRSVPLLLHYGAKITVQVHDELVGIVPVSKAKEFLHAMTAVMESIEVPRIGLRVDGGVGSNWSNVEAV